MSVFKSKGFRVTELCLSFSLMLFGCPLRNVQFYPCLVGFFIFSDLRILCLRFI